MYMLLVVVLMYLYAVRAKMNAPKDPLKSCVITK